MQNVIVQNRWGAVQLDAAPGNVNQFGFTIRVPVGVVAAIAPFNFPLNLVCHKVGPALAAGNSVVLKPAGDTPLSALKLTEILLEAGLPEEAIQCVTGSGAEIGDVLTGDPRIRKITFTGSVEIGDRICRNAGVKRVTMELGSNSPLIIMSDADLEKVAAATAAKCASPPSAFSPTVASTPISWTPWWSPPRHSLPATPRTSRSAWAP